MAKKNSGGEGLREIRHDAVPGYLNAFLIAAIVMGLYLALVLFSSPGSAKKGYGGKAEAKPEVAR